MIRKAPRELAHGPEAIETSVGKLAAVGKQPLAEAAAPGRDFFSEPSDARVNLPNAITLSGYAATIGWLAGGPSALAVYGLVADEADGRVARATGQSSDFGGLLDWAVDLTLTGLVLARLGWSGLLVIVTPVQAYLRQRGYRPAIGSARAAFTVIALAKGWLT